MSARLYCGHVLDVLRRLPEASVRCCVCSPPYWGLRAYGTTPQVWGGDPSCEHDWTAVSKRGGGAYAEGSKKRWQHSADDFGRDDRFMDGHPEIPAGTVCAKCSAWRGELGLEPTPELYVEHMVQVFREVRRVLTDDGTLWLNIGDCYATGGGKVGEHPGGGAQGEKWRGEGSKADLRKFATNTVDPKARRGIWPMTQPNRMPIPGLKPKDLVMMPARLALALQADGWWLRSDIIWSKPNPMPESVTDRPTKSHEYVFLLSKSARYFYEATAIREADVGADHPRNILQRPEPSGGLLPPHTGIRKATGRNGDGRNARSVWEIATRPYRDAHFATFPEELARRCILAGSAPGDTVLDPFGGSGTVAQVAIGNGRSAIYIDLNPAYVELARERIGPMLCEVVA